MRKAVNVMVMSMLLLILSACESSVDTKIGLNSSGNIEEEITLSFIGEAAQTVKENVKVQSQIVEVMATKIGSVPRITKSSDSILFVSKIGEQKLNTISAFTGVRVMSSTILNDIAKISIVTEYPSEVVNAIKIAVSKEPDREALTAAIFESTSIGFVVTMPGKISKIDSKINYTKIGSNSVKFNQNLNQYEDTEIEIESNTEANITKYIAIILILLLALLVLYRRLKK